MPILTAEERVGTELGTKYRLHHIIGKGAMGTVYAAEHTWTGRKVAIKLLNTDLATDQEAIDRLLKEAKAAASLRHPNVVDVLDMGSEPSQGVYLVLEYLEGESLAERLRQVKRLTHEEALVTLLPLMDGLEAAHRKRIVHRDVKPENIFLATNAAGGVCAKLVDFGIAKVIEAQSANSTRTGLTLGTPAYMSPEQVSGREIVGPAADVWSMGVVLYETLSGVQPFRGENVLDVAIGVTTKDATPLQDAAPELPVELTRVVDRALKRSQAERYASMQEFIDALKPFVADIDALRLGRLAVRKTMEMGTSGLVLDEYGVGGHASGVPGAVSGVQPSMSERAYAGRRLATAEMGRALLEAGDDPIVLPKHRLSKRQIVAGSVVAGAVALATLAWALAPSATPRPSSRAVSAPAGTETNAAGAASANDDAKVTPNAAEAPHGVAAPTTSAAQVRDPAPAEAKTKTPVNPFKVRKSSRTRQPHAARTGSTQATPTSRTTDRAGATNRSSRSGSNSRGKGPRMLERW